MTGFSSVEGVIAGQRMRLELKSVNHRFLDVKTRLPRDLSNTEVAFRGLLQAGFSRGALEAKLERITDASTDAKATIQPNLELAKHYFAALQALQKSLGLNDPIRTMDIATLPDVLSSGGAEVATEDAWKELEPLAKNAIAKLADMRRHEGSNLARVIHAAIDEMDSKIDWLRQKRAECEAGYKKRITDKIQAVFEAHPLAETSVQAVLESRIAQELSLLIDRTDIEEELTRFKGHLEHFRKVMNTGGQVGRKLDFILQELHREINTLGNKAQDFMISEEVVQVKVRLEQLREQVMNIE